MDIMEVLGKVDIDKLFRLGMSKGYQTVKEIIDNFESLCEEEGITDKEVVSLLLTGLRGTFSIHDSVERDSRKRGIEEKYLAIFTKEYSVHQLYLGPLLGFLSNIDKNDTELREALVEDAKELSKLTTIVDDQGAQFKRMNSIAVEVIKYITKHVLPEEEGEGNIALGGHIFNKKGLVAEKNNEMWQKLSDIMPDFIAIHPDHSTVRALTDAMRVLRFRRWCEVHNTSLLEGEPSDAELEFEVAAYFNSEEKGLRKITEFPKEKLQHGAETFCDSMGAGDLQAMVDNVEDIRAYLKGLAGVIVTGPPDELYEEYIKQARTMHAIIRLKKLNGKTMQVLNGRKVELKSGSIWK